MSGAYPRTSTEALSENLFPFLLELTSEEDIIKTLKKIISLRNNVNVYHGNITIKTVANDLKLPYSPIESVL